MANPLKVKNLIDQIVGKQYLKKQVKDFNEYNKYYGSPDTNTGIIGRELLQDRHTGNLNPDTTLIKEKAKFYDYYGDDSESMSYDEALRLLQEGGLLGKPY